MSKKLHPRNRHNQGYDFTQLVACCPKLQAELIKTPVGTDSINFSNPKSVLLLNEALLKSEYGIQYWQLAENFLCPPIPGRVDYLHYLADLLAITYKTKVKKLKERNIRGLDIGCGASLIYPLLGHKAYGWQFVGCDIHLPSVKASQLLVEANSLSSHIDVRHQPRTEHSFKHIIKEGEFFDFTMCNPPFHKSAAEAETGSKRKLDNLASHQRKRRGSQTDNSQKLNFSGQSNELWCDGGESAFIRNMIEESKAFAKQCYWFTSLVAKKENLPAIKKALQRANVTEHKIINMTQGQKVTRVVCWTFQTRGTGECVKHL
ncbi:23S rRNA (adenine(1618)-N(6))-methyltransferase RlmF [Shewanella sp. 202IG2-18]|uniref:23S rRNA (adenine(1618)-N(6))-methyltransferase RlmF n=1 Tax=Parashewanella hymeniacidonis TaxID=2807618 RepID=UPI00196221A2|nr:23S rRNA (adenine(1618)-N(6))-methyltransferase RlmF [Parashewanella hymeniacidonis]MBM7071876.1 23S rRNA (adenine(1618)-N(6))-methyltransferase RlmF [Parashewanella hymeniacidonis]